MNPKDQTVLKRLKAMYEVASKVTEETRKNPDAIPQHAKELMTKVHAIKFGDPGLDHMLDSLKKGSLMIGILSAYWLLDYTRGNTEGCHKHAASLEGLLDELRPVASAMRSAADSATAQVESETATKH